MSTPMLAMMRARSLVAASTLRQAKHFTQLTGRLLVSPAYLLESFPSTTLPYQPIASVRPIFKFIFIFTKDTDETRPSLWYPNSWEVIPRRKYARCP